MAIVRLFLILSFLSSVAFANPERDKIISLAASLPKITTAQIQREKTLIPIDFSKSDAKSQIKDFDVILLGEGVYSNFGDFTAKYVRLRGQGPRKTIISNANSSPILVNSTEFWDVSMTDAKFKLVELSGLWAVNVEFAGAIQVKPAGPGKSPAFTVRTAFSDITHSDLPTHDDDQFSNFATTHGERTIMPIPGDFKDFKSKPSITKLLDYEDQFDRSKDLNLKNRIGYKGLFARGLNYFYQKEALKPQYDLEKFNQLVKNARSTKTQGHIYVSMLYWAEADRLSGHSRFDEVLKEISPLTQSLAQECGCTVEGQGIATNVKSEIEQKLYASLPITGLPGPCTIQTMQLNKGEDLTAARKRNQAEQMIAYQEFDEHFQRTIIARSSKDEDFVVGDAPPRFNPDASTVADIEIKGIKKSYKANNDKSVDQNIVTPITTMLKEKFAKTIKEAKMKIASSNIVIKMDGFITETLYGSKDPNRETAFEELHEQQFGRKVSSEGAMSSVFAY